MKIRLLVVPALLLFFAAVAFPHCDTLDGPVVMAAKRALQTGNVAHALIWVHAEDEADVRAAFVKTRAGKATEREFFETLVRLHRKGEGAPFAGLKPAGTDLGPAIPAADRAVAHASSEAVLKVVMHDIEHGVRERLEAVNETRNFQPDDIRAGREYVKAYIEFMHYVEGIHQAASGHASTHE